MTGTNSKIENVLLLNMSTLPNRDSLEANYYCKKSEGGNYLFSGISQLEAGTKFIISRLALRGIKLDRIVVTASPETLEYHRAVGCSAFEFYKKKVLDYISGIDEEVNGEIVFEGIQEKLNSNRSITNSGLTAEIAEQPVKNSSEVAEKIIKLYRDEGCDFVKKVDLESTGTKNITTIKSINDEVMNGANNVKVYIDVQGGDRSFTYILNALMALSEGTGMNVERAISTKFVPGSMVHEIDYSTEAFKLVEFITAVKAFTNYGRADLLKKYFDDAGYAEDSSEREFVKAIGDVSDAIQICSPYYIVESINNLNIMVSDKKEFGDPFLEFVREDIVQSYGEILKKSSKSGDFIDVDIIELAKWTLENGFLQQALTIIESLAPEQMAKDGIYFNCRDEEEKRKLVKELKSAYKRTHESQRYKFNNIPHYIVNDKYQCNHIAIIRSIGAEKFKGYSYANQEALSELIGVYYRLRKLRNNVNHVGRGNKKSLNDVRKIVKEYIDKYIKAKNSTMSKVDSYEAVYISIDDIKKPNGGKATINIHNKKNNSSKGGRNKIIQNTCAKMIILLENDEKEKAKQIMEEIENKKFATFLEAVYLIYESDKKAKKVDEKLFSENAEYKKMIEENVLGLSNREQYFSSIKSPLWKKLLNVCKTHIPSFK